MPARGRDQPWLPQYYAVLGRRAACRGRCGVARPLPAHRTGGSVRPAGGAGGDDCSSWTILGIGGGTSRRARLVRRAGKAEDRHSVGGLWATQRRSRQGVDRGLLPAEMTALLPAACHFRVGYIVVRIRTQSTPCRVWLLCHSQCRAGNSSLISMISQTISRADAMPPFCSQCVEQFVSTKGAFCLPTHIVWQAARFTKPAEDPIILAKGTPHMSSCLMNSQKRKELGSRTSLVMQILSSCRPLVLASPTKDLL